MQRRYKIANGFLAILGLALISLGLLISHTSDCPPAPVAADSAELITAVQYRCYGSPDVLELVRIEKPVPKDGEVLVRVRAAALNPLDWHYMRGSPYVMRLDAGIGAPQDPRLGVDFAGTVEAVGSNVTRFKVGDDVFGAGAGAFAEYLTKHESGSIVLKPANVSFAAAAAAPIAGITALQALRDRGKLKPGQQVLINGASGGVGTFAVPLAKSFGATVTGVNSASNETMVRAIGADHVIDYRQADYTEGAAPYDLIVDMIGNHSLSANLDALKPDGRLVIVGGPKGDWIGALANMIKAPFVRPFVEQEIDVMLARMNPADLATLAELMQKGELTPVIDRVLPLSEISAAMTYVEDGHARGKVIIETE